MNVETKKGLWEIVDYAYKKVPLYKKLMKEKELNLLQLVDCKRWEELPIIEKNMLTQRTDEMISEEYYAQVALNKVIHTHTSGSTGTFLDVYWKKQDLNRALVPLWIDRWKKASICPSDKLCQFNTTLEESLYQIENNRLIISKQHLLEVSFFEIYDKIRKFSPRWVIIHPTIAKYFIEKIKQFELPTIETIKYIEVTGEIALPGLINKIQRECNCIVGNHYGCMEVQTIGYQEKEKYRLYDQSTYVEILDDFGNPVKEDTVGNIYVTSLHNRVMPIIRYGTGDKGCIFTEICNGKVVRYLKLEKARSNDMINLNDSEKIFADILLKPIEMINGYYQNVVYQFQAIQISYSEIKIKVVMDTAFSKQKFVAIYLDIMKKTILKKYKFMFEFGDYLFPASNGKNAWFSCRI